MGFLLAYVLFGLFFTTGLASGERARLLEPVLVFQRPLTLHGRLSGPTLRPLVISWRMRKPCPRRCAVSWVDLLPIRSSQRQACNQFRAERPRSGGALAPTHVPDVLS